MNSPRLCGRSETQLGIKPQSPDTLSLALTTVQEFPPTVPLIETAGPN